MDKQEFDRQLTEQVRKALIEQPGEAPQEEFTAVSGALTQVKKDITTDAIEDINKRKFIKKHSRNLAKISDEALGVEIETQKLRVASNNVNNKVRKQEIKNRLIELKTQAIQLKKEQKQTLKEQKADHKKRNKSILWETYAGKLESMGYDYVPNKFVLKMLLACDGVKSFFDGLGKISTAMLKCFKWIIILGLIIAVIMLIPVTRNYILGLFNS